MGLPKSRYRLSESALPEVLEDDDDVREDTLLTDRDRETEAMDRDRPILSAPDRDLEELDDPVKDCDRERDRLDPLVLPLTGLPLGLNAPGGIFLSCGRPRLLWRL